MEKLKLYRAFEPNNDMESYLSATDEAEAISFANQLFAIPPASLTQILPRSDFDNSGYGSFHDGIWTIYKGHYPIQKRRWDILDVLKQPFNKRRSEKLLMIIKLISD